MSKWTDDDIKKLIDFYSDMGKMWCCKKLDKTEGQVRDKASRLGLRLNKSSSFFKEWQGRARNSKIGKKRPIHSAIMKNRIKNGDTHLGDWAKENGDIISKTRKEWYKNNDHPKGFKNHKHKKESKKIMSIKSKNMWNNKTHRVNSDEYRQMLSDRMMNFQKEGVFEKNKYSRSKSGYYIINGKEVFFRSSWEANYALYLNFLIKNKQIKKWEFEVDTFWFEKIKRGVRSYKPDFKVYKNNGDIEYHEVKGWMDTKSNTKLKRMKKYHPQIEIILVDKDVYTDIKNKVGRMLKFY